MELTEKLLRRLGFIILRAENIPRTISVAKTRNDVWHNSDVNICIVISEDLKRIEIFSDEFMHHLIFENNLKKLKLANVLYFLECCNAKTLADRFCNLAHAQSS